MGTSRRVVVIGGVAAGTKAASRVARLDPAAQVMVIEKGAHFSYAGCGLPYYVMDLVRDQKDLLSTPAGVVRDAAFFAKVKNVNVRSRTEALEIDRDRRRVRVRDLAGGEETWVEYDALVIATGARPVVPPIPGIDLANVTPVHTVPEAERIKALVASGGGRNAVIIGGGLIGVEMAEALAARGCRVTMIEMLPQVLNILDWDMAKLVEQHMIAKGVRVLTGVRVTALRGEDQVSAVATDAGELPADLVIVAVGVRPNADLARKAGLAVGDLGGITVDARMRTSDPNIYAAGDCVENTHLITGGPCFVPLGSTANKQGRVAANALCGVEDAFPGVLGSAVCKVFDFCVARTGLTESQAKADGRDVVSVIAPGPDRPHYMPSAKSLLLKLVVDRCTRKLIGAQAVGPGAGDKRIDVAAMAITADMTVDQLAKADLCYAPPFSPAMDNIITAADVARNKLDGVFEGISAREVKEKLDRGDRLVLLDARSPAEFEEMRLPRSVNIPLGALRARHDELNKDAEIVAFCKVSLRGYEAALILKAAGFRNVRVLDGGIAAWPYEKET
ncbi:MAG TPA: FAD-dependent oxidoreductase [Candidatus Hydrogenedentes bacterium]|nr:FAD-dependent oxidoreductase [Candidatus Hydrogenedentota bacterium]